ncbi:HsdM family class I SAM-dependent methyltransferase [Pelotomaculum propionicicum]|uniref:HsdM family class I SAM-dependent methyltransferase n=1 Tax=Pelotomaculum propionicicum TaxID=258475 RepID=UPI003B7C413A
MNRRLARKWYDGIDRAKEILDISKERDLTLEEIEELKTLHTGYGGLTSFKSDQFFTPEVVTSFLVDMVDPKDGWNVLEFSCGCGAFLNALTQKNSNINLTGIELSYDLAQIASLCYPKANIIRGDALDYLAEFEGRMNLVISNPPFGMPTVRKNFEVARRASEQYFLEMAVRCLKPGGVVALILPEGIFCNSHTKPLRKWLMEKCYYLGTISLPIQTFYFAGTGVKTSIMLAKKKYPGHEAGNYPVFMAICEEVGWDNRGKPTGKCDLDKIREAYFELKPEQDAYLENSKTEFDVINF